MDILDEREHHYRYESSQVICKTHVGEEESGPSGSWTQTRLKGICYICISNMCCEECQRICSHIPSSKAPGWKPKVYI